MSKSWLNDLEFRSSDLGRKKLSSIDRTNMVGIKARMSLSRFVGLKFI